MRSILRAAAQSAGISFAAMFASLLVKAVGIDRYEAWYRAYSLQELLGAAIVLALVIGASAVVGFRAGAPLLYRAKAAGTLAGITGGFALVVFLLLTGKEYSGGFAVPILLVSLVVSASAFYLARLDAKAGSNVV